MRRPEPPLTPAPHDHADEVYDQQYFRGHGERYQAGVFESRIREVEPYLRGLQGKHVLDSGCGYGFFTTLARERGAEVVAFDSSAIALSLLITRTGKSISAVRGDALAVGLRDDAFDLVLSADMIEHVADGATYLREIHRVLKPGGRCVLITNNDRGLFKIRGLRRLYYQPTKQLALRRKLDTIKSAERSRRYDERAHINLFSIATLAAAAREAGFEVTHWHTFPFLRHRLRDRVLGISVLKLVLGAYLHDYLLMVLEKPDVASR